MFIATQIVRNKNRGYWSICLRHKESEKDYWLDASLNEQYHDVEVDWNQYIFYLTDADDLERQDFQADCDNFDEACSEVVCILEKLGEIYHGEDGDWYNNVDTWKEKSWWITK